MRAYRAASGELIWQDRLGSAGGDFQALALAANARQVFGAGLGSTTERNTYWLVRAYDATSGTLEWQDLFERPGVSVLDAVFAVAARGLRVFAAGRAGGPPTQPDWLVRAYAMPSWHRYSPPGRDSGRPQTGVVQGR